MPQTPFPIQQGEKAAPPIAWLELLRGWEEVETGGLPPPQLATLASPTLPHPCLLI